MCLEPVGKFEMGGRDVGVLILEIAVASGVDMGGHRIGQAQAQDHRDVVGRKAPEDVLLGAVLSEVQAMRVDVLESAECPLVDELSQFHITGMILEQVPDHQDPIVLADERAHAPGIAIAEGEGLFDVDILACGEGVARDLEMRGGRSRDDHRPDLGVFEYRAEIVDPGGAVLHRDRTGYGLVGIADRAESSKVTQDPREVLAPTASAHERYVFHDLVVPKFSAAAKRRASPWRLLKRFGMESAFETTDFPISTPSDLRCRSNEN